MNKTIIRSLAITAILSGAVFLLIWYWNMRREIPAHARVIPSDVIAVLTLNVRELAVDHATEEHLFPEMADANLFEREFEPVVRAITANDGESGIEHGADVLLFAYRTGNEGYFAAAVKLSDSTVFGELVRKHISKEYSIQTLSMGGNPLLQFDTTAAVFGWTEDVALLLYPLGNHSIANVTAECAKLLKQQKENSVLANQGFQDLQMQTFAMGLWIQTDPLLKFTDGGSLVEAIAHDVETYCYMANFEDGEILIRSEWHLADETKRDMIGEFNFPCDTSLIAGFIRGRFDINAKTPEEHSFANEAFSKLPIAEEDYPGLFANMTGDYISINHSRIDSSANLETHCFLLSQPDKAKAFVTTLMQRDSIPLTNGGWTYAAGFDNRWRMIVDDNMLTLTNHAEVDGRAHAITPDLAGYMAWFNFQKILKELEGGYSEFIPFINTDAQFLSGYITTCSSTLPVQFGSVRHSEVVLRFRDKNVNGLVQAEELVTKMSSGK